MTSRIKKPWLPNKTKTCNGKNCYKTRTEAEKVAIEQELQDLKQELRIKVYFCAHCGNWHLTKDKLQD